MRVKQVSHRKRNNIIIYKIKYPKIFYFLFVIKQYETKELHNKKDKDNPKYLKMRPLNNKQTEVQSNESQRIRNT